MARSFRKSLETDGGKQLYLLQRHRLLPLEPVSPSRGASVLAAKHEGKSADDVNVCRFRTRRIISFTAAKAALKDVQPRTLRLCRAAQAACSPHPASPSPKRREAAPRQKLQASVNIFPPFLSLIESVVRMGSTFLPPTSIATLKSIKSSRIVQSICFDAALSRRGFGY